MLMEATRVWNACGYVRLSCKDGDRRENESIASQVMMIRNFFSNHPELLDCGMRIDEGYSGSDFHRPAFQEMMTDVKAGRINCIVVKDLSRFGRDHLSAGEYIEQIFPFLGVRFIAITDRYDSLYRIPEYDDFLIPFRNLINEAYCHDISAKVRSQLEIKRRQGEFIGAFAAFGYQKDPENHNRLIVDDYAADVVRDMFRWKMEGFSSIDIAKRMNTLGLPTPLDYKMSRGLRYTTPFRYKTVSSWDAKMVLRILQNPIYIGTLEQGRSTTPSYKNKRLVIKPRKDWAIVENCHEPIVDRHTFETVRHVLLMDTRTAASGKPVEPFCGMVFCGECGAPMTRKTTFSGHNRYVYYVCMAHKSDKSRCSCHSLRAEALEQIVLVALQKHMRASFEQEILAALPDEAAKREAKLKKLRKRVDRKQGEIMRLQHCIEFLEPCLKDGLIDQKEYEWMRESFTNGVSRARLQAGVLQKELKKEEEEIRERQWKTEFQKYGTIMGIDRLAAVTLLDHILIYRNGRIGLVLAWREK